MANIQMFKTFGREKLFTNQASKIRNAMPYKVVVIIGLAQFISGRVSFDGLFDF